MVCTSTGAFWPGVQPEDGNRSPYDERMYGDDGRDDWRMPYGLFPGQARIQQTGTAAFVSPGPQGVRPCINCSDILPLGSSTTLNVGSDSAQDCVCNPGDGYVPDYVTVRTVFASPLPVIR
jgi:hypothetical protein